MDEQKPASTTIPSAEIVQDTREQPAEAAQQPQAQEQHPQAKDESTSLPKPPPPRPSQTTLQKLRLYLLQHLQTAATKTDRTLLRLANLLSTPSGIDVTLCTISYTLTLLRALLSRLLARRLASIANEMAAKASDVMLPGETLVTSLPVSTSTKLMAQTVGSTKAIAETIADYRIFVRMWGLLGMYTWARGTYLSPLPADASTKARILRALDWSAISTCVAFQVLENGAYLSSKGALTSAAWSGDAGKARENIWWLWSSRFWAAYVGVELVRLGITKFYTEPQSSPTEDVADDGEKEDKIKREEQVKKEQLEHWLWCKDLASNLAYAPMTIHWSLEKGLLSDWGVGACGMVAGGALLADAWRKTA